MYGGTCCATSPSHQTSRLLPLCFAIQVFLYKHEYDRNIEIDNLAFTSGLIIVDTCTLSNCQWAWFIIEFTQVWGPFYFLISWSSSLLIFVACRLHEHLTEVYASTLAMIWFLYKKYYTTLWRMSLQNAWVHFGTKHLTFVQGPSLSWLANIIAWTHSLVTPVLAHAAAFSTSNKVLPCMLTN